MEKAQEIIKKYVEDDNVENLIKELKENLDIRYNKLKTDMEEKNKLYEKAQKHIEELSQGVKSSEELKASKMNMSKELRHSKLKIKK